MNRQENDAKGAAGKYSPISRCTSILQPYPCPTSARTAAMMFVQATPMRSIDGMTRADAADRISDRTALAGEDKISIKFDTHIISYRLTNEQP